MHWCPRSWTLITLITLSLANALRIDDSDTTVQYNGAWTDGHNIPDDVSLNWDGTLHYSNISGATATVTFTGTAIDVYGSLHPPGRYSMQSQYTVDGQQPSVFLPDQEVSVSTHQKLFYSSPQFPYGEHTLVVTNLGEQLFIDFFNVQNQTITSTLPPSTTPAVSETTQAATSPSGGSLTVTVTTTAPAQSKASDSSATSQTTTVESQSTSVIEGSLPLASTTSYSPSPTLGTTRPSMSTTAGSSTATVVSAAQSPTERSSQGLSKGTIAGIAVGSVIIVAVLGAALWWYRSSRERTWLVTDLPGVLCLQSRRRCPCRTPTSAGTARHCRDWTRGRGASCTAAIVLPSTGGACRRLPFISSDTVRLHRPHARNDSIQLSAWRTPRLDPQEGHPVVENAEALDTGSPRYHKCDWDGASPWRRGR